MATKQDDPADLVESGVGSREASGGEPDAAAGPAAPAVPGIKKKVWFWIAAITLAVWAFTLNTGSTVLLVIVSVLTVALIVVLVLAFRMIRKQRKLMTLMQGSTSSPEARRDALAKLAEGKDANAPVNVFARAQLLAADDPPAALKLLETVEFKSYPAAMQDDVALLATQLYLNLGNTAKARKSADSMNLDNPARKEVRALAAVSVAEAWARTGKPKEALALLETIEPPKLNADQIEVQMKIVRVFAKFAANQRAGARTELVSLADLDLNYLGRFVMPQFRVHPELQKLATQVMKQHPAARKMAPAQSQKRAKLGG